MRSYISRSLYITCALVLAEANNYTNKQALSEPQREWLAEWARLRAPGDQRAMPRPVAELEQ